MTNLQITHYVNKLTDLNLSYYISSSQTIIDYVKDKCKYDILKVNYYKFISVSVRQRVEEFVKCCTNRIERNDQCSNSIHIGCLTSEDSKIITDDHMSNLYNDQAVSIFYEISKELHAEHKKEKQ